MIRERIKAFARAFRLIPHTLCYSVKANSSLAILRLIARARAGFDVVSGELSTSSAGVDRQAAKRVVYSGVGKTVPEMEFALRAGILLFNIESASELEALAETAARMKRQAAIAMRVNPDDRRRPIPTFDWSARAQVRRAHSRGGFSLREGRQASLSEGWRE